MKKDRLKPYVHKIKGAAKYALYDILNGNFYKISPVEDIQQIREGLKNLGLIFETKGEVPFKIEVNVSDWLKNLRIRELQIRLNGRKEDTCWQRRTVDEEKRIMNDAVIDNLRKNLEHLPVQKIRIEAEETDMAKIEKILTEFNSQSVELYTKDEINNGIMEKLGSICRNRNIDFVVPPDFKKKIDELEVKVFNFFYNQYFNPCLGHQVAIDTWGEIKPCLWSDEILGNIKTNNLKDMIISGVFNKYWEMAKDKIEVCKDCEKRYACDDCRISAIWHSGGLEKKPGFCDYNPYDV